jgi:hypothetical protein
MRNKIVTFHMFSGNTFTIEVKEMKITRNPAGDITGYKIEDPDNYNGPRLLDANLGRIEAITWVPKPWWK